VTNALAGDSRIGPDREGEPSGLMRRRKEEHFAVPPPSVCFRFAWAMYRDKQKWLAPVIDSRELVVLLPGMGIAKRYIIAIADENRTPLDSFCAKLIAADFPCDVMRNTFGGPMTPPDAIGRGALAVLHA